MDLPPEVLQEDPGTLFIPDRAASKTQERQAETPVNDPGRPSSKEQVGSPVSGPENSGETDSQMFYQARSTKDVDHGGTKKRLVDQGATLIPGLSPGLVLPRTKKATNCYFCEDQTKKSDVPADAIMLPSGKYHVYKTHYLTTKLLERVFILFHM